MDIKTIYLIQIISTISVVPALFFAFASRNTSNQLLLNFSLFLLVGFAVDLFGWYAHLADKSNANRWAQNIYCLIETLFMFWFASRLVQNIPTQRLLNRAWIVLIPFWLYSITLEEGLKYFMVLFQITISFVLSYLILQFIEREKNVWSHPLLWILVGAFVNYFCTFFFMYFWDAEFGTQLWYLKNIISTAANFMYAWAFFIQMKSARKE